MVASIAIDGARAPLEAFQKRHGLTYPVLLDSHGYACAAVTRSSPLLALLLPPHAILRSIPYNVVIDRRGIVRNVRRGFDADRFVATVEDLVLKPLL